MRTVLQAPAKLNLALWVTGRRADGFHDLLSLAAPIDLADRITVEPNDGDQDRLTVSGNASIPTDADNLVLQALAALRAVKPDLPFLSLNLEKRIPSGAGLGGGSSDAAAILRYADSLGAPLPTDRLTAIAARIGSDVPLFLESGPVIFRGRGEQIERAPASLRDWLSGQSALLYPPGFPVATGPAFGRLQPALDFTPSAEAEAALVEILEQPSLLRQERPNAFERSVFERYPALPILRQATATETSGSWGLTGSGSTLFAIFDSEVVDAQSKQLAELIQRNSFPSNPQAACFLL